MSLNIHDYYDLDPEKEWMRTQRSFYAKIEYEIVQYFLDSYTKEGDKVLDMGCGPGIHALSLIKKGRSVALADISQRSLAYAVAKIKSEGGESHVLESVCTNALDYKNASGHIFDTALLLGPLYHTTDREDRAKTFDTITGSVKKGGYIFSIFITRHSTLRDICKRGRNDVIKILLDNGYMEHGIYSPALIEKHGIVLDYMPETYGATLKEAKSLHAEAGLEIKKVISCESFYSFMGNYIKDTVQSEGDFQTLKDVALRTCENEDLVPGSDHFLIISQKP